MTRKTERPVFTVHTDLVLFLCVIFTMIALGMYVLGKYDGNSDAMEKCASLINSYTTPIEYHFTRDDTGVDTGVTRGDTGDTYNRVDDSGNGNVVTNSCCDYEEETESMEGVTDNSDNSDNQKDNP